MSHLEAPLLNSSAPKTTTDGVDVGPSSGTTSRPPALPRVPSRVRRGDAVRPQNKETSFSTQSDPPPDAARIQNRVRYSHSRTQASYDSNPTDDDGLEPELDIFTRKSYNTVDFESESFDVPQKGRSHLNLMPAVKQFAIRNGYEVDGEDLELTFRAFFIGGLFALLNAAVNMFFAFRYAGGLQQYWVILVSYPVAKATEKLPRGLLNPGLFRISVSTPTHTVVNFPSRVIRQWGCMQVHSARRSTQSL